MKLDNSKGLEGDLREALQLLLPVEAAAALRMKVGRLYALIREGRIPVIRIGRRYRISKHDLEAFVASRRVEGLE